MTTIDTSKIKSSSDIISMFSQYVRDQILSPNQGETLNANSVGFFTLLSSFIGDLTTTSFFETLMYRQETNAASALRIDTLLQYLSSNELRDVFARPSRATMSIGYRLSNLVDSFRILRTNNAPTELILNRDLVLRFGNRPQFRLEENIKLTVSGNIFSSDSSDYIITASFDTAIDQTNKVFPINNTFIESFGYTVPETGDEFFFMNIPFVQVQRNVSEFVINSENRHVLRIPYNGNLMGFEVYYTPPEATDVNVTESLLTPRIEGEIFFDRRSYNYSLDRGGVTNYITVRFPRNRTKFSPADFGNIRVVVFTTEGGNGNFTLDRNNEDDHLAELGYTLNQNRTDVRQDSLAVLEPVITFPPNTSSANYVVSGGRNSMSIEEIRNVVISKQSGSRALSGQDLQNFINNEGLTSRLVRRDIDSIVYKLFDNINIDSRTIPTTQRNLRMINPQSRTLIDGNNIRNDIDSENSIIEQLAVPNTITTSFDTYIIRPTCVFKAEREDRALATDISTNITANFERDWYFNIGSRDNDNTYKLNALRNFATTLKSYIDVYNSRNRNINDVSRDILNRISEVYENVEEINNIIRNSSIRTLSQTTRFSFPFYILFRVGQVFETSVYDFSTNSRTEPFIFSITDNDSQETIAPFISNVNSLLVRRNPLNIIGQHLYTVSMDINIPNSFNNQIEDYVATSITQDEINTNSINLNRILNPIDSNMNVSPFRIRILMKTVSGSFIPIADSNLNDTLRIVSITPEERLQQRVFNRVIQFDFYSTDFIDENDNLIVQRGNASSVSAENIFLSETTQFQIEIYQSETTIPYITYRTNDVQIFQNLNNFISIVPDLELLPTNTTGKPDFLSLRRVPVIDFAFINESTYFNIRDSLLITIEKFKNIERVLLDGTSLNLGFETTFGEGANLIELTGISSKPYKFTGTPTSPNEAPPVQDLENIDLNIHMGVKISDLSNSLRVLNEDVIRENIRESIIRFIEENSLTSISLDLLSNHIRTNISDIEYIEIYTVNGKSQKELKRIFPNESLISFIDSSDSIVSIRERINYNENINLNSETTNYLSYLSTFNSFIRSINFEPDITIDII